MLKAQTLTALRTFEAAGRLMSFSQAAEELCVTTGAVSQQIRKLESELGTALFIRKSRSMVLTDAGEALLETTRQSLSALTLAVQAVQAGPKERILRLTATPSFAFHWLIPRLADFHQRYPTLRVEVRAVPAVLDRANTDFELAIDYSPSDTYRGYSSQLLLAETLLPVMAPTYRADFDCSSADDWRDVALLHDTEAWPGAERHAEWRYWLEAQGLGGVTVEQDYYFNRVDMAIEAAAAGLGVAMARKAVVQEALASGRLIAPCPALMSPARYHVRVAESQQNDPAVRQLVEWLLSQVQ